MYCMYCINIDQYGFALYTWHSLNRNKTEPTPLFPSSLVLDLALNLTIATLTLLNSVSGK